MGKLDKILGGQRILEKVNSSINGELTVVRDFAWGTYIKGGGLTQSGGVAESVWRTSIKRVKGNKNEIDSALILGLGGGSIAKLIRKKWSNAKITGVDIDPVIVGLGEKHMNLESYGVETFIDDAENFLNKAIKNKKIYDLICVDMYVQDNVPEQFTTDEFLEKLKMILEKDGIVVFNRLYYGEKRPLAVKFGQRLEKIFSHVDVVYPEANVMFICTN